MDMNILEKLGWDERLEALWRDFDGGSWTPGRVVADYGASCRVATPGELTAEPAGRLRYVSRSYDLPKIGDWVALQPLDDEHGLIHEVLPRKNEISRKQPGDQLGKQVLAANIDVAFVVQSLDDDFSPQRLHRYLFQLRREGIRPVVVLNKADKADDIDRQVDELRSFNLEILIVSALENQGIDKIAEVIEPATTAVFLGSSGVGKSTITNVLLGAQRQITRDTRSQDSKGRHTTTHRELFVLPNGGLIIDTPGLRELQLWGVEGELDASFPDIEELAATCKFSNCSHLEEPGCAVLQAIETGTLEQDRLDAYSKLQKELKYLATQTDVAAAQERKQSYKQGQKQYNQMMRQKKKEL
jgi:ribosome biogenesis GTPase